MREVALAGWALVRAPYLSRRYGLAGAERCLNEADERELPVGGWRRLRDADTEQARTAAVNDLLAATLAGWQLAEHQGRWRVRLIPEVSVDPAELAAVQVLVLLVEAEGWSRLGRCNRAGCHGCSWTGPTVKGDAAAASTAPVLSEGADA